MSVRNSEIQSVISISEVICTHPFCPSVFSGRARVVSRAAFQSLQPIPSPETADVAFPMEERHPPDAVGSPISCPLPFSRKSVSQPSLSEPPPPALHLINFPESQKPPIYRPSERAKPRCPHQHSHWRSVHRFAGYVVVRDPFLHPIVSHLSGFGWFASPGEPRKSSGSYVFVLRSPMVIQRTLEVCEVAVGI